MTDQICPVCQAQLELSADGLYDVCPVCGYSRLRAEDALDAAAAPAENVVRAEEAFENAAEAAAQVGSPAPAGAPQGEPVRPEGAFAGEYPPPAFTAEPGEKVPEEGPGPVEPEKPKKTFADILNILKRVGIVVLGLAVIAAIVYGVILISHRGQIRAGVSADDIVGENYQVAEAELRDLGFTNVELVEKLDLGMGDQARFKTVSQVSIDGDISFKKRSWFSADAPVVITYHDLDPARSNDVQIPESSKAYEGQNYSVVLAKLQAAGFTNIELQPIYDLSFFSRGSEGEVDRVLLDPDVDLSAGDWVSNGTLIKIYYHEKKSKSSDTPELAEDELLTTCSAKDLKGETVEDAVNVLKKQGFTNVTVTPLKDLRKSTKKDGKVDSISIDGHPSFKKGDVFPKNAEVIVSYHSVRDAE